MGVIIMAFLCCGCMWRMCFSQDNQDNLLGDLSAAMNGVARKMSIGFDSLANFRMSNSDSPRNAKLAGRTPDGREVMKVCAAVPRADHTRLSSLTNQPYRACHACVPCVRALVACSACRACVQLTCVYSEKLTPRNRPFLSTSCRRIWVGAHSAICK
jgi:hypothetical protein